MDYGEVAYYLLKYIDYTIQSNNILFIIYILILDPLNTIQKYYIIFKLFFPYISNNKILI
jgi:hypothetical protein